MVGADLLRGSVVSGPVLGDQRALKAVASLGFSTASTQLVYRAHAVINPSAASLFRHLHAGEARCWSMKVKTSRMLTRPMR